MASQATVVAQAAILAALQLSRLQLEDLSVGAIKLHGNCLEVRGNGLGNLIWESGSGVGMDVCRFGGLVQTAHSHTVFHLLDKGNVRRDFFWVVLHLKALSAKLWLELFEEDVDAGVVRPVREGLDNCSELDYEV